MSAWTRIFDFKRDYETDPLVGLTYFGGAMASYGGYLYFGTINNPLAGPFAALLADQQGVINIYAAIPPRQCSTPCLAPSAPSVSSVAAICTPMPSDWISPPSWRNGNGCCCAIPRPPAGS